MIEKRFSELRQTGERRLEGVVITYGEIADIPQGKEKFVASAFGDVASLDVILNSQHQRTSPLARTGGGGLTLTDSQVALTLVAQLPPSQAGDDALNLVRAGVLRGLSLEFVAISERHEDGVRAIEKAELSGIAVVDRAAYLGSEVVARNEERQSRSGRIRGRIPYNRQLECGCLSGDACGEVLFENGSFAEAISDPNAIAFAKDFSAPLGSTIKKTLEFRDTPDSLEISISLPSTSAARDLIAASANVPLIIRPLLLQGASDFTEAGGVASFKRANVRAFLVGATDAREGWEPAEVSRPRAPRRRRHLWL